MIIVWRGWGILVPVFVVAAFFVAAGVQAIIPGDSAAEKLSAFPITGIVAGAACWLFQQRMEKRPKRVFIDEATGQKIAVGADAGSFFFIPTRFWAFILPGLSLVLLAAGMTGNLKP